jgi:hypothetical protein
MAVLGAYQQSFVAKRASQGAYNSPEDGKCVTLSKAAKAFWVRLPAIYYSLLWTHEAKKINRNSKFSISRLL